MLPCISKYFFETDCPGCGLQRSVVRLFEGDLGASLALYPGLLPVLAFFIVSFVSLTRIYPVKPKFLIILAVVAMIIVLGHYMLKMTGNAPWFDAAEMEFHR